MNIEQQNAGTARRELNEYELRYTRVQDEINHLRREKEQLLSNVNLLKQQVDLLPVQLVEKQRLTENCLAYQ